MDGIRQFLGGVQYALQPSEAAITLQQQPFACGGGTLFPVKVLLAVLPVKMRHTRIYCQDDYHPVLFQGIRTIQLKLP